MVQHASATPGPVSTPGREEHRDEGHSWIIALAAASGAERLAAVDHETWCDLGADNLVRLLPPNDPRALIRWEPDVGWRSLLPSDDPRHGLLDLYLPICSATAAKPMTVGHLGLSLDGFIATHTGDSQFVTGHENILHLHRMRALSDAVVVGAGTVAADDPQLTTRHVPGPNPLRVVFDPARRLTCEYRMFTDDSAPTWYCCERSLIQPSETHLGSALFVGLDSAEAGPAAAHLLQLLREHGCSRVFVEGGGVTVSAFLEANLLDRLQMAIAPLIIGDGIPAIRVSARSNLRDCLRPQYRVFRMGGDVLFDCELTSTERRDDPTSSPLVSRVI
jgi:diaminohydroxyphosphoribosylaminopyrimidine deaminase / 5-amino-6-(5-phosphoribosylamino)uracil reductase